MNKQKLLEIVRILKEIKSEEKLSKLKDDILFDCAKSIYLSEEINESKERHIADIKSDRKEEPKKEFVLTEEKRLEWAKMNVTEEQAKTLQNMKYNGNMEELSKLDAYELIKSNIEIKKKLKEGIGEY